MASEFVFDVNAWDKGAASAVTPAPVTREVAPVERAQPKATGEFNEDSARSFAEATVAPQWDKESTVSLLGVKSITEANLRALDGGEDLIKLMKRQAAGPRGLVEAVTDIGWADAPFIGDVSAIYVPIRELPKIKDTFKKLESGDKVTDQELVYAQLFLTDQERRSQASTGGMVGEVLRAMPGFAAEIGAYTMAGAYIGAHSPAPPATAVVGGVTGAVVGTGKAAVKVGTKIASKFLREGAEEAAERWSKKIIANVAGRATLRKGGRAMVGGALAGTGIAAADTAVNAAYNLATGEDPLMSRQAGERYVGAQLAGDDMSMREAQLMALGDRWIEYVSEKSGEGIGALLMPGKGSTKWITETLDKNFPKAAGAIREKAAVYTGIKLLASKMTADGDPKTMFKWLKNVGYDGYVEEMLEERFGGFARGLFGIEGDEDENRVKNALRLAIPDRQQFAVEAISFAVPIVTVLAAAKVHRIAAGQDTPEMKQHLRNVLIGTKELMAPHVERSGDDLSYSGGKAAEGVTMSKVVDSVGKLYEMNQKRPKGAAGKIMDAVTSLGEMIVTGNFMAFSRQSDIGQVLSRYGREDFPAMWGEIRRTLADNAQYVEAYKGLSKEALDAKIDETTKEYMTEILGVARKSLVLSETALDKAVASLDGEDPESAKQAIVEDLRGRLEGDAPRLKVLRIGSGRKYNELIVRTEDGHPVTEFITRINKAANEVLDRHGINLERKIVADAHDMSVEELSGIEVPVSEIQGLISDPFSIAASRLRGVAGIGPTYKNGPAILGMMLNRHKALLESGAHGIVFERFGPDGTTIASRVGLEQLADGRFRFMAKYSNSGSDAERKARIKQSNDDAEALNDSLGGSTDINIVSDIAINKFGFKEDKTPPSLKFSRNVLMASKNPRVLASIYGFESPDNAKVEKYLVEQLEAIKTKDGYWGIGAGNLNDENQVAVKASANLWHTWEELSEHALRQWNLANGRSAFGFEAPIVEFLDYVRDLAEANIKTGSKEEVPMWQALVALLDQRTEQGQRTTDAPVKLFGHMFLGYDETEKLTGDTLTFSEQIKKLLQQGILDAPSKETAAFAKYMGYVTKILDEGGSLNQAQFALQVNPYLADFRQRELAAQLVSTAKSKGEAKAEAPKAESKAPAKPAAPAKEAAKPAPKAEPPKVEKQPVAVKAKEAPVKQPVAVKPAEAVPPGMPEPIQRKAPAAPAPAAPAPAAPAPAAPAPAAPAAPAPAAPAPAAPAAKPEAPAELAKDYKGIPLTYNPGKAHPVHGGVAAASVKYDTNGKAKSINLDLAELKKQFADKQWAKPRVPGVLPLAEDAFPNLEDFVNFVLEHELQHDKFPRVSTKELKRYAQAENDVNKAAEAALGVSVYPKAAAPAPVRNGWVKVVTETILPQLKAAEQGDKFARSDAIEGLRNYVQQVGYVVEDAGGDKTGEYGEFIKSSALQEAVTLAEKLEQQSVDLGAIPKPERIAELRKLVPSPVVSAPVATPVPEEINFGKVTGLPKEVLEGEESGKQAPAEPVKPNNHRFGRGGTASVDSVVKNFDQAKPGFKPEAGIPPEFIAPSPEAFFSEGKIIDAQADILGSISLPAAKAMARVIRVNSDMLPPDAVAERLADGSIVQDLVSDAEQGQMGDGDARTLKLIDGAGDLAEAMQLVTGLNGYQSLYELTHEPASLARLMEADSSDDAFVAWVEREDAGEKPAETALKAMIRYMNELAVKMGGDDAVGYMSKHLANMVETMRIMVQQPSGEVLLADNGKATFEVLNRTNPELQLRELALNRLNTFQVDIAKEANQLASEYKAIMTMPGFQTRDLGNPNPGRIANLLSGEQTRFKTELFKFLHKFTGAPVAYFETASRSAEGRKAIGDMVGTNLEYWFYDRAPASNPNPKVIGGYWFRQSLANGDTAAASGALAQALNDSWLGVSVKGQANAAAIPNIVKLMKLANVSEGTYAPTYRDSALKGQAGWTPMDKYTRFAAEFFKAIGSEDTVDNGGIRLVKSVVTPDKRTVYFGDMNVFEMRATIQQQYEQGYLYTGVYGDKVNNRFIKIPSNVSVADAAAAYRKLYEAPTNTLLDQSVWISPEAVDQMVKEHDELDAKIKTGNMTKADSAKMSAIAHEIKRIRYVTEFDRIVDGDARFYAPKLRKGTVMPDFLLKTVAENGGSLTPEQRAMDVVDRIAGDLLDARTKRRGNDLTGGRDLSSLERHLKDVANELNPSRPRKNGMPRVLVIKNALLGVSTDGMALYRASTFGRGYVRSQGDEFAGNPDAASTVKFQISATKDVRGARIPVLDKLNSVAIEQLSADPERTDAALLQKFMEEADIDIIIFDSAEKVPSGYAYSVGFLPDDRLAIASIEDLVNPETVAKAQGLVRSVSGSDFIVPLALHGPTEPSETRFAKQLQQLMVASPNGEAYRQLIDEYITAVAANVKAGDYKYLTDIAVKQLGTGDSESKRLAAALKSGNLSIVSPAIRSRVNLMQAVLKSMQFTQARIRGPLVMRFDRPDSGRMDRPGDKGPYKLVNANIDSPFVNYVVNLKATDEDAARAQFARMFDARYRKRNPREFENVTDDMPANSESVRIPFIHAFEVVRETRPAANNELASSVVDGVRMIDAGAPHVVFNADRTVNADVLRKNVIYKGADGVFRLHGSLTLGDRIPADGSQSMRAAFLHHGFPDATINLIEQDADFVANAGVDGDGDSPNLWLQGDIVDTSPRGIQNRFLGMVMDDYLTNPVVQEWANRSIEKLVSDIITPMGEELKFGPDAPIKPVTYSNTRARLEYDWGIGQLGKNTVGTSAKANTTMRRLASVGGYMEEEFGLKVPGHDFTFSHTAKDAADILNTADPTMWHRFQMALHVSPQMAVQRSVDDAKAFILGHMKLVNWRLAIELAGTVFNKNILHPKGEFDATGKLVPFSYEAEFPAAAEESKAMTRAVAKSKFLDAVDNLLNSGTKRLDADYKPARVRQSMLKVADRFLTDAERKGLSLATKGLSGRKMFKAQEAFILSSTNIGAWIRLHDLAESIRIFGAVADIMVVDNNVQTVENIEGANIAYVFARNGSVAEFKLLNPERLAVGRTVMDKLLEALPFAHLSKTYVGERASFVASQSGEGPSGAIKSTTFDTALGTLQAQTALRNLIDQNGGLESLDVVFPIARVLKLREAHPDFFNLLAPSGMFEGALELVPVYSGPRGLPLPEAVATKARAEFDKMPRQLQLEVAVAALSAYDVQTGPRHHSFTMLMGDPETSQFVRDMTEQSVAVFNTMKDTVDENLVTMALGMVKSTNSYEPRFNAAKQILNVNYVQKVKFRNGESESDVNPGEMGVYQPTEKEEAAAEEAVAEAPVAEAPVEAPVAKAPQAYTNSEWALRFPARASSDLPETFTSQAADGSGVQVSKEDAANTWTLSTLDLQNPQTIDDAAAMDYYNKVIPAEETEAPRYVAHSLSSLPAEFKSTGKNGKEVTITHDPDPMVGWLASSEGVMTLIPDSVALAYWNRTASGEAPEAPARATPSITPVTGGRLISEKEIINRMTFGMFERRESSRPGSEAKRLREAGLPPEFRVIVTAKSYEEASAALAAVNSRKIKKDGSLLFDPLSQDYIRSWFSQKFGHEFTPSPEAVAQSTALDREKSGKTYSSKPAAKSLEPEGFGQVPDWHDHYERKTLVDAWVKKVATDLVGEDSEAEIKEAVGRLAPSWNEALAPYLAADNYETAFKAVADIPVSLHGITNRARESLRHWALANMNRAYPLEMHDHNVTGSDADPTLQTLDPNYIDDLPEDYGKGRATYSVSAVVNKLEDALSPYRGAGASKLTKILVDEADAVDAALGKINRFYEKGAVEWGLTGRINKYTEHTYKIDPTGRVAPYVMMGRALFDGRNADTLNDEEKKLNALIQHMAFMGLEHTKVVDGKRVLDNADRKNVRIILPALFDTDLETLELMLPKALAKKLFDRIQEARTTLPEFTAEDTPAQAAEKSRVIADALAKAAGASFVRVPIRPGDALFSEENPENNWKAAKISYTVSLADLESEMQASSKGEGENQLIAKLIKNNRDASRLTVETIVNETAQKLDELSRFSNGRVPWSMSNDAVFMRYRNQYSPHYFGTGFYGPNERAVKMLLDKAISRAAAEQEAMYLKVLGHSKGSDGSVKPLSAVSDRMLEILFSLKGLRYQSREDALALIASGTASDLGLNPDMTYADAATEIHNELIEALQERAAANADINAKLHGIDDPAALAKALRTVQTAFKDRESTNRSKARTHKTFEDAFVRSGRRPRNMGALDALHKYSSDVLLALRNRVIMNQLVQVTDAEGTPLVIPEPNLQSGLTASEQLLTEEAWNISAERMARWFSDAVDPATSARENVERMIQKHVVRNKSFVRVESPYESVPAFYAYRRDLGRENVMDALLSKGEVAGILSHVFGKPWQDPWGILKGLEHLNQWMKIQALQLSLFFPIAGQEGLAAVFGHKFLAAEGGPIMSQVEWRRMIKAGHPYAMKMIEEAEAIGIKFSSAANPMGLPAGMIERDIEKVADFVEANIGKRPADGIKAMMGFSKKQTNFMFESYYNTVKIWTVQKFAEGLREKALAEGREFDFAEEMLPYVDYINAEVGGVNWNKYSWMTPTWKRNFSLLMFSPDWGISAWNAAGGGILTGPVMKNFMTDDEYKFIFTRRWPQMALYVMLLTPMLVQAVAYAVGLAAGTVGDDDEWLIFNNEEGRKLHADLTPMLRAMPWYGGAPTGQRRSYIRWGKQAYETQRWLESPWNSLMSKSSQIARWAIEQATGTSGGSQNFPLPFKDQGLIGLIRGKDGDFMGSRLGYTVQKFMPFSILAWAQNPDASPLQVLGPVSKGMSFYTATQAYTGLLDSWARDTTYANVYKNQRVKANLEALGQDILNSVEKNGYDPEAVITAAKGAVLKDFYAGLYRAINANDQVAVEKWSRCIIRLNGTVQSTLSSVKNRNELYGKPEKLTEEQRRMVREAFDRP